MESSINNTDTGGIIRETRSLSDANILNVNITSGMPPVVNASDSTENVQTFEVTNDTIISHSIPKIPVSKFVNVAVRTKIEIVRAGSGMKMEVTNPAYLRFYGHAWFHPRLLATGFFAMSTVISLLRLLSYAVVSDVIGPFKISLGTMVTETLHFLLIVCVVVLSFAFGLTYLYKYYNEVDLQKCILENDGKASSCPSGKLSS